MTQNENLLAYLVTGKAITPLKARHVFRVESLSSRVSELRRQGHDIQSQLKRDESGKVYAEYRLVTRKFGRRVA